jgi:DNA-binding response OmpR family regulator
VLQQTELNKTSILCVEDDPDFLDLLCRAVGNLGAVVVGAPSSEAAMAIFRVQRFDLVITDLTLPRESGVELIASVRVLDPTVPILVVTGSTSAEAHEGAIAAGATACLVKPVEFAALAEIVSGLLRASLDRLASAG